jgi:rubredoxin
MYKKDTAIEIQFAPQRLNDAGGDPYWIDLSAGEALRLLRQLETHFAKAGVVRQSTGVFSLDAPCGDAIQFDGVQKHADASTPAVAVQARDDGFKQWVCVICGFLYDEAAGSPREGIAAGTRWEEIPDNWRCPLCDVGKEDFVMVEF